MIVALPPKPTPTLEDVIGAGGNGADGGCLRTNGGIIKADVLGGNGSVGTVEELTTEEGFVTMEVEERGTNDGMRNIVSKFDLDIWGAIEVALVFDPAPEIIAMIGSGFIPASLDAVATETGPIGTPFKEDITFIWFDLFVVSPIALRGTEAETWFACCDDI